MTGSPLEEESQIETFVFSVKVQSIIQARCISMSDRLVVLSVDDTIIVPVLEFQVARHQ